MVPVAIALLTAYWVAAQLLPPYYLAAFTDGHGYQLAGGFEILSGRHPVLDFKESYGPLVFYVSAMAQWLSGGGLLGEMLLLCAAHALAYVLFFRLLRGAGIAPVLALVLTLLAVWVLPVPYRYYINLLPILFFTAAWRYTEQPSTKRLATLAAAIAATGLFRPDFGVYTTVAGVVLVAVEARRRQRAPVPCVLGLLGLVLLWATPWLGWLAAHGKLPEYFTYSSVEAFHKAEDFSRAIPPPDLAADFFTRTNAKAFFFRLPLVIVAVCGVVLALRRAGPARAQPARFWCALVFAGCSLLQVSHVIDWMHVRDVLPICILLLGWLAAPPLATDPAEPRGVTWLARGFVGGVAVGCVVATAATLHLGNYSPRAAVANLLAYRGSREALVERMRLPGDPYGVSAFLDYVRTHTRPDQS
ncbi:MAG: hypothetical protein RLZZ15_3239, partial [Verrucomicrobiota bacterium]